MREGWIIGPAAQVHCIGEEFLFGAASPCATMVFMRVLRKSSYFSRFQVRDVSKVAPPSGPVMRAGLIAPCPTPCK